MTRIVYTVNTGGYDVVAPPRFREPDTRYILFTDGPSVEGWERVEWPASIRESRAPKILPHRHLPEHEMSLYMDACLRLKQPPSALFGMLNGEIAACRHPNDQVFQDHFATCAKYKLDNPETIRRQRQQYIDAGMPIHAWPLSENSLLLRRNTARSRAINEMWWSSYTSGSVRDQLSLPYALWATGNTYQPLPFPSRKNVYYDGFGNHVKPREMTAWRAIMATVVHGQDFENLFQYIEPWHRVYAARHGYDYGLIRRPRREWPSPSWWKLELSWMLEEEYDVAVFMDADAWPWENAPCIVNASRPGTFSAFNSADLEYMVSPDGTTQRSYRQWCEDSGNHYSSPPFYVNAGVWVCWRAARHILQCGTPTESDHFFEQHQVNHNLAGDPDRYSPLSREWNYGHIFDQARFEGAMNAHICHLNGIPMDQRLGVFRRLVCEKSALSSAKAQQTRYDFVFTGEGGAHE